MQFRSLRGLAVLAGMSGLATLIFSESARADLDLTFQTSGNSSTAAASGSMNFQPGSPTGAGYTVVLVSTSQNPLSFGGFGVMAAILSEQNATPTTPTNLNAQGFELTNNSGGVNTITVTLTGTGYTIPGAGPAIMSNSLQTTLISAQDPTNSISMTSTIGGITSSPLTINDPVGTQQAPSLGGLQVTGTSLGSPFAITETFIVTLANGASIDITGYTAVVAPEPGTIAMALTALPLLGIGAWVRRRSRARPAMVD